MGCTLGHRQGALALARLKPDGMLPNTPAFNIAHCFQLINRDCSLYCSPLASDAAETRRTLDFCARMAAGAAGSPFRAANIGPPGSPPTGSVADLANVFGGSTPRSPVNTHSNPRLSCHRA